MLNTIEANMPMRIRRFVLPYEPEYTAHRNDARISRITELHRKLRDRVLSPPIAPELLGCDRAEVEESESSVDKR
jgi:hypothetical protein